jgi:hypothetical protein
LWGFESLRPHQALDPSVCLNEFLESLRFRGFAKPTGARLWLRVDHKEKCAPPLGAGHESEEKI